MAQLVAHHTGSVGVRGSSPLSSTRKVQVKALVNSTPRSPSRSPSRFGVNCAAWRQSDSGSAKTARCTGGCCTCSMAGRHPRSFNDQNEAEDFRELANRTSPARAVDVWATKRPTADTHTVASWCIHHADHLTGVNETTRTRYRRYIANDILPSAIGPLPLTALTNADVARWLNGLTGAAKTAANKHGFLAGALNSAVRARHIASNPCDGNKLRRDEPTEMVFLTHTEFATLLDAVTATWKPLVEFLVASGARWGEASALKPGDIDLEREHRPHPASLEVCARRRLPLRTTQDQALRSHHRCGIGHAGQARPVGRVGVHKFRKRPAGRHRPCPGAQLQRKCLGTGTGPSQGNRADQAAPRARSKAYQCFLADPGWRALDRHTAAPWA